MYVVIIRGHNRSTSQRCADVRAVLTHLYDHRAMLPAARFADLLDGDPQRVGPFTITCTREVDVVERANSRAIDLIVDTLNRDADWNADTFDVIAQILSTVRVHWHQPAKAFVVDSRVATRPHTDHFAAGDKFGTVVGHHHVEPSDGEMRVGVRMDRSGRTLWFRPEDIEEAYPGELVDPSRLVVRRVEEDS